MPAYQREVLVRFAHCDPAGIVFHARYFEMINGVVEDWFEDAIGTSFSGLLFHRNLATPTVHFDVDFTGRSVMGDRLTFFVTVERFGTSSFDLRMIVTCGGEERMRVLQTLLFTDPKAMGSVPIPPDLLKRMQYYAAEPAETPEQAENASKPD